MLRTILYSITRMDTNTRAFFVVVAYFITRVVLDGDRTTEPRTSEPRTSEPRTTEPRTTELPKLNLRTSEPRTTEPIQTDPKKPTKKSPIFTSFSG